MKSFEYISPRFPISAGRAYYFSKGTNRQEKNSEIASITNCVFLVRDIFLRFIKGSRRCQGEQGDSGLPEVLDKYLRVITSNSIYAHIGVSLQEMQVINIPKNTFNSSL